MMTLEGDVAAIQARQDNEMELRRQLVAAVEEMITEIRQLRHDVAIMKDGMSNHPMDIRWSTVIIISLVVTGIFLYDPALGYAILKRFGVSP